MESESKKILDRLDISAMERIKEEAELVLSCQSESESIIVNKANSLFQILVVLLVSSVGYIISQLPCIDYKNPVNICCIVFLISLSIAISFLLNIVHPKSVSMKGAYPSELLKSDIFDGSKYETEYFLGNRIISLDSAIQANKINQSKRVRKYKQSIYTVLIGLLLISIAIFILACV